MRKFFALAAFLFFGFSIKARAATYYPPYEGTIVSSATGTATYYLSGSLCAAASTATAGTCGATVNGNGTISATTFSGSTFSGKASSATNVAGGSTGSLPVQSAANTTSFLPVMNNGGIIIGTGGIPSTGTITGTSNEISVTNGNGTISLAGAGQTVTCGSQQAPAGGTYNAGILTGGTCTSFAIAAPVNPEPSWQGINYIAASSSGTTVAYSTAASAITVVQSTIVYEGAEYNLGAAHFTVIASTFGVITANSSGYTLWGLTSLQPAIVSSNTVNAFSDSIIVAAFSTSASSATTVYPLANWSPIAGVMWTSASNGSSWNSMSGGQVIAPINCGGSFYFDSCSSNAPGARYDVQGSIIRLDTTQTNNVMSAFVFDNTSGATQTMNIINSGTGNMYWCVDAGNATGAGNCTSANNQPGTGAQTLSLPTGYHVIDFYIKNLGSSTITDTQMNLPAGVTLVRPGYM
jgi:hypothetical protein